MMKIIKQTHKINSEPDIVFAAMTNPITIELWSGYEAKFIAEPGTEFSIWEGDIVGKNLELVHGKLLKQQWYFEGQEEPSIVTIKFSPEGSHTVIELTHENIPDEAYDDMKNGWKKYYFGALRDYFSS
jgi:activator of HSP90 ATPase